MDPCIGVWFYHPVLGSPADLFSSKTFISDVSWRFNPSCSDPRALMEVKAVSQSWSISHAETDIFVILTKLDS